MPEPWTTERPRLLVVADDQDGGELLARLLDRAGWTTDLAFSAAAGLRQLEDAAPPYDAVVLDLTTPTQNIDVVRVIRGAAHTTSVRVVVCARATDSGATAGVWAAGADGHLVHPFDIEVLIDEIATVVARPDDQRHEHRQLELERAITQD